MQLSWFIITGQLHSGDLPAVTPGQRKQPSAFAHQAGGVRNSLVWRAHSHNNTGIELALKASGDVADVGLSPHRPPLSPALTQNEPGWEKRQPRLSIQQPADFCEDVKHLYTNDDSKPHYVQREVIFAG